jgi:FKBP-type peptidyl-prolyl cis-trans isomerase FklB
MLTNKWIAALALGLVGVQTADTPKVELKTDRDKQSYALGVDIGRSFKKTKVDLNTEALAKGIKDALGDSKLQLTDEEIATAMTTLRAEVQKKQQEAAVTAAANNKKEGEAFLAANKGKEGVVSLTSGLQYKILKAGTGAKPKANSNVQVHYKGSLIDGTVFDESYSRGEPVTLNASQVIKGWTEALQLMPVGSKWQLFIPSNLAYGEHGAGGVIGPNAALIFEVELLAIK